jgi:sugar lactone lactonase YvrE
MSILSHGLDGTDGERNVMLSEIPGKSILIVTLDGEQARVFVSREFASRINTSGMGKLLKAVETTIRRIAAQQGNILK